MEKHFGGEEWRRAVKQTSGNAQGREYAERCLKTIFKYDEKDKTKGFYKMFHHNQKGLKGGSGLNMAVL